MATVRSELQKAKTENTKANKEYESLKGAVLKVVQGKSPLSMDFLSEMVDAARNKVVKTSERITELTVKLESGNAKIAEMQSEYKRIMSWSEIFDSSEMQVKKMMAGYIIKGVTVKSGYNVDIEFAINVEQFLHGIHSDLDCVGISSEFAKNVLTA